MNTEETLAENSPFEEQQGINRKGAMKLSIDKRTLSETLHCKHELECLNNESHICRLAEVEHCVAGKVHFIKCTETICNYKIGFGNSIICSCPVRKNIYNKYNK